MQPRLERMNRPPQRVDRHGRRDVGGARETSRPRARRGPSVGGAGLRAVDERQALFGAERDRRASPAAARARPAPDSERAGVYPSASPFAHEDEREVGEGRQVAARADRSAGRHTRMHARVGQREERVERLGADARVSLRQHVGAKRDERAHDGRRQRLADAGGVAAQQIQLQGGELMRGNRDLGQRAESGVDAVDGPARGRVAIDDAARGDDARARLGREAEGRRRVRDVVESGRA